MRIPIAADTLAPTNDKPQVALPPVDASPSTGEDLVAGVINDDFVPAIVATEAATAIVAEQAEPHQPSVRYREVTGPIDAVFADTDDPDYQTLLAAVEAAAAELRHTGSFEIPGFFPKRFYIREMKRFGILPDDFEQVARDKAVDLHAIDQAYWRSLQWPPPDVRPLTPAQYLKEGDATARLSRTIPEAPALRRSP